VGPIWGVSHFLADQPFLLSPISKGLANRCISYDRAFFERLQLKTVALTIKFHLANLIKPWEYVPKDQSHIFWHCARLYINCYRNLAIRIMVPLLYSSSPFYLLVFFIYLNYGAKWKINETLRGSCCKFFNVLKIYLIICQIRYIITYCKMKFTFGNGLAGRQCIPPTF